MGVSSATLAPFWANDFSTANWADETWFWPARNKDHSIRPAVQRKNCRVGKETGPGELGMVCTGIVCAQTLGWFPGSLKWSINWNQLWENFGCSFSLDVHNLMLSALFAGCCAPRLLGRAAAFPLWHIEGRGSRLLPDTKHDSVVPWWVCPGEACNK